MSDFSGMGQPFVLPVMAPAVEIPLSPGRFDAPPPRARSYEVQLDEVQFRRVRGADEMHAIQRLRSEIQLPGTALADPGFALREKKETGKGWSAHSSGAMSP